MTDIATLGLAVDSGPVKQATSDLTRFNAASKAAEQGAQRVEQSFAKTSETAKRLSASLASARSASAIDARMGISGGGASTASRMADVEAYGAALDDLRAKYSPLFAIEQQHAKQLAEITKAHRLGAISTDEMNVAIALSEAKLRTQSTAIKASDAQIMKMGKSAALSSFAMTNLAFQVNDVATQAALGMDPMRILAAQGGQFYQILATGEGGLRGSFSYLTSMLKGLITPFRLVTAGALGMSGAGLYVLSTWRSAQREIDLALTGIGSAAGVTAGDINRIAYASAAVGKATVGDAREMALAFASTGKISAELTESLLRLTKGTGRLFGEDQAEAAARLAKAFADPAKGVDDLNARLAVFDASTRDNIRNLAAQNDRIGAQQALLAGVRGTLEQSAGSLSVMDRLWTSITTTVSLYASKVGEATNRALGGGTLEQQLADAQKRLVEAQRFGNFRGLGAGDVAEAAARVEQLTAKIAALNKEAAEKPLIERSNAFSAAIRAAVPDVQALMDAKNALEFLQKVRLDPAAARMGDLDRAQLERAIQLRTQEVQSIQMRLDLQESAIDIAKQENDFALQGINARTAAQRAELAYVQTLAREQRAGNVAALFVAASAKAQVLAEENRRIGDEVRARNFAAKQAIELAQLELSLVGATADEAARLTAAFQARQQVQAQAYQSYRTASDVELVQAQRDAATRASIESATRRKQLLADIAFEREQMNRSATEREVYARMQSEGLLQNGQIVGAQNQAIAGQLRLNAAIQSSIDTQREFTGSLLRDLMAGKSAAEALGGALEKVAQKMLDNSLDMLFSGLGGGATAGGLFGGAILPGILHSGGIAGNDNVPRRAVSPLAFAGAARYHNGGIAGLKPDEVPAILQEGERVLSRNQTAAYDRGGNSQVVDVRVSLDSALLRAVVVDESGRQIATATTALRAEQKQAIVGGIANARSRRIA
ncbi:MAG TPA: phage tail length tape measure family protein [Hyphomicrobium sp.]|nr:phage tail length tape measure family protein [Hyphomicrobium sp.]